MAGSQKWFVYESDHGIKFAVQMDESNAEAMGFEHYGSAQMAASQLPAPYTITPVPTNLEMRYANCIAKFTDSVTGGLVTKSKSFLIPTIDTLKSFLSTAGGRILPAQSVIHNGISQNVVFHIISTVGEKWKNLPTSYDTYQDDGDNVEDGAGAGGAGSGAGSGT